jgi:hypothetical protein
MPRRVHCDQITLPVRIKDRAKKKNGLGGHPFNQDLRRDLSRGATLPRFNLMNSQKFVEIAAPVFSHGAKLGGRPPSIFEFSVNGTACHSEKVTKFRSLFVNRDSSFRQKIPDPQRNVVVAVFGVCV